MKAWLVRADDRLIGRILARSIRDARERAVRFWPEEGQLNVHEVTDDWEADDDQLETVHR